MTDYLIDQYNAKIEAARVALETAVSGATALWNNAIAELISNWQGECVSAGIELQHGMDHRNRVYVQGPPPDRERETEPTTSTEVTFHESDPDGAEIVVLPNRMAAE